MLTRLRIRNFKLFDDVDIELGAPVVLIGPNNSGKTTALQALALWEHGLRQWNAKHGGEQHPERRPGVTINRLELAEIPVPGAKLLWRRTDVRRGRHIDGQIRTENIRIDIVVDGITKDVPWSCGMEFDYSNQESFVFRPMRESGFEQHAVRSSKFIPVPPQASSVKIAYLPPMSGLAPTEPKWEIGRVNVLIGEGQTAQVLRNLCHHVYEVSPEHNEWEELCRRIRALFGVRLLPPKYVVERGEVTMQYENQDGTRLDLSCSGRGMLQTLLLLSHLYTNPRTVLLLDEPDAHLEIIRQRQTFRWIADLAEAQGSQIIAASHSEVVMNEAAGRGRVIAFVGKPHVMNDRGSQLVKSLTDIGWDQYYQAELKGWVLYVEDSSDLAVLQAFAGKLEHPGAQVLEQPFVHYVSTNLPQRARDHFFGLREGKPDLVGVAIFDRLDKELHKESPLVELMWSRREIENYFCVEEVLLAYASEGHTNDLFALAERDKRERAMREAIREVSQALHTLGKQDAWSPDLKATDDFLDPLFRAFFAKLGLPLSFRKSDYHVLARLLPKEKIDPEVVQKLNAIVDVARRATPRTA